jgi:hypothetical protein
MYTMLGAVPVPTSGWFGSGADALVMDYPNLGVNGAPDGAVVTANVVMWARPQVLLMGSARYGRLTPGQRALLRNAAAAALDARSTDLIRGEAEEAQSICLGQTRWATATGTQISAMHEALAPAIRRIRGDPDAARLLDVVAALRATLPPPVASAPCASKAPPVLPAVPKTAPALARRLNGTYRFTQTAAEAIAAGIGADAAPAYGATNVMTLKDGRFVYRSYGYDDPSYVKRCIHAGSCIMASTGRYVIERDGCLRFILDGDSRDQGCYRATLFRDRLLLKGPVRRVFWDGVSEQTTWERFWYTNAGRGWQRVG